MITLDETNKKIDHILFIGDTHGDNRLLIVNNFFKIITQNFPVQ